MQTAQVHVQVFDPRAASQGVAEQRGGGGGGGVSTVSTLFAPPQWCVRRGRVRDGTNAGKYLLWGRSVCNAVIVLSHITGCIHAYSCASGGSKDRVGTWKGSCPKAGILKRTASAGASGGPPIRGGDVVIPNGVLCCDSES